MSPASAAALVEREVELVAEEPSPLIPQLERPRLPIHVPVVAEVGGAIMPAQVLGSTSGVLLVQGPHPSTALPPLGTRVRLRLDWDRRVLNGRLAAHGVGGRFLVSIGERPIRGSRRVPLDLPAVARSAQGVIEVRIKDLSSGGARVEGIRLPVGSDVELCFTPPSRATPMTVLGFVVRDVEAADAPTLGVAFRLVQAAMDVLADASSARPAKPISARRPLAPVA